MRHVAPTCVIALSAACLCVGVEAFAADPPIAGVAPDRRPEGAPVITEVVRDKAWYVRALHGIEPPYPPSLWFLDDQGNWYTPFIHPGVPAPYDIRRWHAPGS